MKQKKLIVALLALTNLMGTGSGVNPSLTTYTNSNQLAKVQFKEPNRKAPTSFNLDRFKMYGDYLTSEDGLVTTTDDDDYYYTLNCSNRKLVNSKDGWMYLRISTSANAWSVNPKLKSKETFEGIGGDLPISSDTQQNITTAYNSDYYYFINYRDVTLDDPNETTINAGDLITNENYFALDWNGDFNNDGCNFGQHYINEIILAVNTRYVESLKFDYDNVDGLAKGDFHVSQLVNLDKEYEGILLDGQTKTITVNRSANYTEEELVSMISAKDLFGVDCDVEVEESDYQVGQIGTYTIKLQATDSYGQTAHATLKVVVIDKTPPVILKKQDLEGNKT